jgi:type IV fimbrial biogenesis protein FimT
MQNKHKGFTLIELMVTIAVMAIIAMMAAPSFGDMLQRQNLNKSTRIGCYFKSGKGKSCFRAREITVELLSADENTDDTLNWMPVGKSSLKTGRATEIVFMPTGL